MATKQKLDYNQVAQNIIANIGGKENVNSVRHCITRVRFKLKDESKADDEIVKNLDGVLTVVHGGGEYMVVIGDAVIDVYDAVVAQLGGEVMGGEADDAGDDQKKLNPVMKLLNIVVGAVGPCLNFICAGGILKGLLTLLQMTGVVAAGSGWEALINAAGDAIFFFLPIFLGMNLAKTLKGDPFLGAIIGAVLCYPAINGTDLVLFGMNFNYTYTSTFLPVIAVVAVAVPLAKALRKVLPKSIANFGTPALTLLIVIPLGYALIGPVVSMVGAGVNTGITTLMHTVPLLAGAVFGGFYQVMVLFGIHQALTSFSFMSLLEGNPDYIMAIGCTVSFAQCGVVLAMYLKSKDEELKSLALPSFISGMFGVTEPAIYGVTLPRIKMFILSCVGGAVCGAFVMITNTMMYSFSGLGVFAILGLLDPANPNVVTAVLCAVVPFVFSFVAAWLLYSEKSAAKAEPAKAIPAGEAAQTAIVSAAAKGKVLSMEEVPDPVFSQGVLGQCCGIEPVEGKVYAPVDGEVSNIAESKHAIGFEGTNGVEVLVHVGVDTVDMNGDGFAPQVKEGDKVKKGQLVMTMDMAKIKAAGHPSTVITVVTNSDDYTSVDLVGTGDVEVGADLVKISK